MGDEVDDQARQMDEQARDKQSSRHDRLQPSSSPKRTSKRTTVSLQHLTRSLQDTAVVTRKWSANKPPMFGRSKFQASWIFLHPLPPHPLPLTLFTSYPLFFIFTRHQAGVSAEMTKQADGIKAYAHAMLLEHGMRTSDFDKSKKALAQSYQLYGP